MGCVLYAGGLIYQWNKQSQEGLFQASNMKRYLYQVLYTLGH